MEMGAYYNRFCNGTVKKPEGTRLYLGDSGQTNESAYFLAMRNDFELERLAESYVWQIVCLHEVPVSITSDRDPGFTTNFWEKSTIGRGN